MSFLKAIHNLKIIFTMLSKIFISLIMFLVTVAAIFFVPQVKDTFIALGNFGAVYHLVFIFCAGLLWSLNLWYFARVFYYMTYHYDTLKNYQKLIVKWLPRSLGAFSLLILGIRFLISSGPQPGIFIPSLFIIGMIFLAGCALFIVFVVNRKKLINPDRKNINSLHKAADDFISINRLPLTTQLPVYFSLFLAVFFLVLLIISPFILTSILGDGITILLLCFCIWLPLMYLLNFIKLVYKIPVFILLILWLGAASLFNANKDVRVMPQDTAEQIPLADYFKTWNDRQESKYDPSQKIPLVMVLAEGGGIRAAYYSAAFLSRLEDECTGRNISFSDNLFCVYSVSGGSVGTSVYLCLLKHYADHPLQYFNDFYFFNELKNTSPLDYKHFSFLQWKAKQITGKDFLTPVITAMLTREPIQSIYPLPISTFDRAKIFEKTWERVWQREMRTSLYATNFTGLWQKTSTVIPPVFFHTTNVETGQPIVISPLRLDSSRIIGNIFDYTGGKDLPISSAAHLSARFTYVSPAGSLKTGKSTYHFVDGGYFENTGANSALYVIESLKFQARIKPVVIYLQNGSTSENASSFFSRLLFQAFAPAKAFMNAWKTQTSNAIERLKDRLLNLGGTFITLSLNTNPDGKTPIPLGWALSDLTQQEIDRTVDAFFSGTPAPGSEDEKLHGLLNAMR